ncbi:hypothetical protein [uncultured Pelagimonas sp.]|uniref:hypothetical protein n=1 Tax=uncultured Pelagimonas sp. TaxID=1618102 RepID=UPI00261DE3EF|nr:hypothetical protein [uncultured Pelagimonas sp.]
MPISVDVYPEQRLLRTVYSGSVSVAEVSAAYQKFLATPGAEKVKYALNDLRELDELKAFYDAAAVMADLVASDGDEMADPWDIAIVTNNTGHYPLLLDYASRIDETSQVRCKVLPDIPSAVVWFGLEQDAFGALLPELILAPQML